MLQAHGQRIVSARRAARAHAQPHAHAHEHRARYRGDQRVLG